MSLRIIKFATPRIRFSMRTLFIVLTVAAAWFAYESQRAATQKQAVTKIQAAGGYGYYSSRSPVNLRLLSRFIGDDYFRRVQRVYFVGPEPPGRLTISCMCTATASYPDPLLSFSAGTDSATQVNDDTLRSLIPLGIEDLYLMRIPITNEGMESIGKLTTLKSLCLHEMDIRDEAIVYLRTLRNLETIDLTDTVLSDAALTPLSALTNLRELYLNNSEVTDDGILKLASLPQLQGLYVSNTKVTTEGAARLKQLAPQINEIYGDVTPPQIEKGLKVN
jgi:hypothetical protein